VETKTSLVNKGAESGEELRAENEKLQRDLGVVSAKLDSETSQLQKKIASLTEKVTSAESLVKEKCIFVQQLQANGTLDQEAIAELTEMIQGLQEVFFPSFPSSAPGFSKKSIAFIVDSNLKRRTSRCRRRRSCSPMPTSWGTTRDRKSPNWKQLLRSSPQRRSSLVKNCSRLPKISLR